MKVLPKIYEIKKRPSKLKKKAFHLLKFALKFKLLEKANLLLYDYFDGFRLETCMKRSEILHRPCPALKRGKLTEEVSVLKLFKTL